MLLVTITGLVVLLFVKEISSLDLCDASSEVSSYFARGENPKVCGCERAKCLRRCCKAGYLLQGRNCVRKDSTQHTLIPVFSKKYATVAAANLSENSALVGVLGCDFFHLNNSEEAEEKFYLQEDGRLWVPVFGEFYGNDRYCLDEVGGGTAFLCFPEEDRFGRKFNVVGMIISMPFLLATLVVYALLPESNIHRKALMFYVFTLLMAYVFLVTIQLLGYVHPIPCQFLGYSVIFFFTGSFFWMNVMCIDMWLAFSGMRGLRGQKRAERMRFYMYSLYALGMPTLLVVVTVLLDAFGDPNNPHLPGVGRVKCFLDEGLPVLYYFYGPVALLTTFNISLFILTAIKIQRVKKETSMLKHSDSKRHSYEDDKQKFNLYLKLLFAMGVNWSMEVISWAVQWKVEQVPSYVWYLTDFCNAMYGVFIFFIFVFKKKIWRTLQKRYYVFVGKPHLAHSLTTTQTTRSMSTTDTGINDHNMRELPNGKEERPLTQN